MKAYTLIIATALLSLAFSGIAQVPNLSGTTTDGGNNDPPEKRKVWILSPKNARDIREQTWRNRMSVQFVEPSYSPLGEPTFRRINVNCFEPSVSIQYIENRRVYSSVYIQDPAGWTENSSGQRSLPVDMEPSAGELNAYLQRGCASGYPSYPQPIW